MSIELRSESNDHAAVIHCSGEIKAGDDAHHFRAVIAGWLRQRSLVTVDLSKVKYMDSSGLGELISCYTAIQRMSGRVKLLSPNHRLQNLLVITKLITVFEIFDTESAAIASFAPDLSAVI